MGAPEDINASSDPQVAPPLNEKIAVVTEADDQDFVKSELHIDDEAGEIAAQALASGPADAEVSKKVLRKIDLYILPFLCITYGTQSTFQVLEPSLTSTQACNSSTRLPWATPASLVSSPTTTSRVKTTPGHHQSFTLATCSPNTLVLPSCNASPSPSFSAVRSSFTLSDAANLPQLTS